VKDFRFYGRTGALLTLRLFSVSKVIAFSTDSPLRIAENLLQRWDDQPRE